MNEHMVWSQKLPKMLFVEMNSRKRRVVAGRRGWK